MGEWAYNITQELICWPVYRLLTIQVNLAFMYRKYVHSRDLPHELTSRLYIVLIWIRESLFLDVPLQAYSMYCPYLITAHQGKKQG